jgi:hypothetical protein
MADHDAFAHDLAALLTGRAFVDLSAYRKVRVHGADAVGWLHDLLTADVAGLTPGASCRSLLLTPTDGSGPTSRCSARRDLVLTQSPEQPDHIGLLLGPYVLSSDVPLEDTTSELALFAVPRRRGTRRSAFPATNLEPRTGLDLLAASGSRWRVQDALVKAALVEARRRRGGGWRIIHGIPRMGPTSASDRSPPKRGSSDDRHDEGLLPRTGVGRADREPRTPAARPTACALRGSIRSGCTRVRRRRSGR